MNKTVTIYSTPTCGYCKLAKEYFKAHNVEFTEIDVSVDQQKAREMIEKSGQMGVPVITIADGSDEQLIVGFNKPRLATALGIAAAA
jgi:glutaredoxin 3